jgi:uncharacterized protein with HEPN domain
MRREKKSHDRDPAWLFDRVEAGNALVSHVEGRTYEEFVSTRLLRAAVEREVDIIGEAVRCLSDELKTAHPEIPWKKIEQQRQIVAHDYYVLDPERLWAPATVHVPALLVQVAPLIPALPEDPVDP